MVGAFENSEMRLYVDGKLESFNKFDTKPHFPKESLYIGKEFRIPTSGDDYRYIVGSLDDVRIYNRGLSAEEVKTLYELEKPKAEKKEDSEKPAEVKPSEESPEPKKETPALVEPKVYQSPSGKAYPAHWGAPPLRQTRDLRPLPGGYGNGSGPLARWIQENLDKDALPKTEDPEKETKPAEIKPSEETPSPTEPEEEKKPTED